MTNHNIRNVDKTIFETLNVVKAYAFDDAIIAGGAIRDIFLNRPFNDVDIYIQSPHTKTTGGTHGYPMVHDYLWWKTFWGDVFSSTLAPGQKIPKNVTVKQLFSKYYASAHVEAVWEINKETTQGEQTYQIIFVDVPPEQYVTKYFDFGICMAYSDGTKMRFLPEFRRDVNKKLLTLIGHDIDVSHMTRLMKYHYKKMQKYFPDYKFTVAPHNKPVYDQYIRGKY